MVARTVAENNTRLDYSGNFLYENGDLKAIFTSVGRLVKNIDGVNTLWKYEYNLTDHLGNVRAVFAAHDNGIPELMQNTDYYPFGMVMQQTEMFNLEEVKNRYLYNGKELQDDDIGVKLDWYDYGARFYDPALGRWHSVDPMAEKYDSYSPYHFSGNNPILFIDDNGMDWYSYTDDDGNDHYKYQNGSDEIEGYTNIGASVSININDDVYFNAFQNLSMTSYGESVDLKSKILNDKGLFSDYIGSGSELSAQGQSELFNSYVRKRMGEDGTQIMKGIGLVTGGVIGAGELAAMAPLLGDAAMNQAALAEFYTGNISMLQNSAYAVGTALNHTQIGIWAGAAAAALAPEGTQISYPLSKQREVLAKWIKSVINFRKHTKKK